MMTFARGYQAFKEQIDASIASYLQSCVHCGLCAEACLFYTETGEPKYTPIYKLRPLQKVWEQEYTLLGRFKAFLGLSQPLTDSELAEWQEYLYDTCTLCGRCSLVCPVGNDLVYMIRQAREGMAAAGHAPEGLKGAVTRAITLGSPMGVKFATLQAQIKRLESQTDFKVPIDITGAEYLVIFSSMEIVNFPEYLAAIAKIMRQVGKTWTIATQAFEATNSGIQIGLSDLAKELVNRIVTAAEQLQVKTVISPECGHAYTALRWEGPNLLKRQFPFQVKHILEVLDEFREQGLLKTSSFEEDRLTFHDPCQIARRGGVIDQPRYLLKMVAKNFVEMEDHGKMNWCCGGGGGVIAIEEATGLRLEAFKRKKAQLDALKIDKLVTSCANCRIVMEEAIEEYEMELPVVGLTEMIAEHLEKPVTPSEKLR